MVKSDTYVFTINNYTDNCVERCRTAIELDHRVIYICFGFEVGDCGTPHLQGYLQLSTRVLSKTICTLLGGRARLDTAKGDDQENYEYCSKTREGDTPNEQFEEYGTRASRSKAVKRPANQAFELIRDDILSGSSIADIASTYPTEFIKHHAGIIKMAKILNCEPLVRFFGPFPEILYLRIANPLHEFDWQRSVVVCGETGLCKTQFVLSLFNNPLCVSNTEELKSFRRLEHDAIIFDDVSVAHWPRNSQLHLADVEVARGINVKGSHVTIPAFTKKVFTCNPWAWPFIRGDAAIERRLYTINLE